jgi:hypothetical protein
MSHSGYGARPHVSEAKRPEGYPMDQPARHRSHGPVRPARPMRPFDVSTRPRTLCASDATSCPEKRLFGRETRNQVTGAVDICTLGVHNLANN